MISNCFVIKKGETVKIFPPSWPRLELFFKHRDEKPKISFGL